LKHGWDRFRETEFPAPQDENYILAANPLSRSETMTDVLAFAAKQFDPTRHDFVLITKSHGSARKAITPRLAVRAEETNRAELLRVAAAQRDDDHLPDWAGKLGISKGDYFSILDDAGRRLNMHFPLVIWEACNAHTNDVCPGRWPGNVDRLLLIQRDANYTNLLYGDILKGMGGRDRLADALARNLPSKFVLLGQDSGEIPAPRASASSVPLWVYFTPLALWVGWVVWQWGPWRRRTRP
jgi:hypothetical protein